MSASPHSDREPRGAKVGGQKVLLLSGMDFAGKTTAISLLSASVMQKHVVRHRFLSASDPIQEFIDDNLWIPRDEFVPLLVSLVRADVLNRDLGNLIIQDSLWFLKFAARLLHEDPRKYELDIEELLRLAQALPPVASFYLTAGRGDRLARYRKRSLGVRRMSRSDQLVLDWDNFEAIDSLYMNLVQESFADTLIVNTSQHDSQRVAYEILQATGIAAETCSAPNSQQQAMSFDPGA